jgi:F-type H+-transporting ATPase subunit epsilon
MLPSSIQLEVVTPERQLISDTVSSVQIPGLGGYLGILPGHAPLLTELGTGELCYRKGAETYCAAIIRGFAEVLPDRVTVLADIAERAEEIDADRARAARDRAQRRLSGHDPETDWNRAAAALERAMIRLQVAAKGGSVAAAADNHSSAP